MDSEWKGHVRQRRLSSTWEVRNLPQIGQRVELVAMNDPYTTLPIGTKGTVAFVDDMATIHVKWDNGANLGLVFEHGDRFKLINDSCQAVINHGPGHQSRTQCDVVGPHDVHHACYGSHRQDAYWKGENIFSGFFDEPPAGSDDLEF